MLLALDELVPYAHWITPEGMPKRFDTWFFLAAAPPEQVGAHDGKESTDSIWVSPREALAGGESGRFKLPFPTTRNLIRLGKQPSVKAALDDARGRSDRHRDAGDDKTQRRPPAPHPAARPAMTARCSKSARCDAGAVAPSSCVGLVPGHVVRLPTIADVKPTSATFSDIIAVRHRAQPGSPEAASRRTEPEVREARLAGCEP